MKATTWFCQLFLFSCAIHIGYATQRANYPIAYPWDYMASNFITEKNLMLKRNAPSLSIINPLDVLRKRLLLEMARRQMKENTRQVELNRTILKNVGKRIHRNQSTALDPYEYMTALDSRVQDDLLTYQPHTHPNRHFISATSIFDYMKRYSPDVYKSTAIATPLLDKKNTPINAQFAGEKEIEMNVSSSSESSINDSDDDGFSIVSDGRKTFGISTITDQQ